MPPLHGRRRAAGPPRPPPPLRHPDPRCTPAPALSPDPLSHDRHEPLPQPPHPPPTPHSSPCARGSGGAAAPPLAPPPPAARRKCGTAAQPASIILRSACTHAATGACVRVRVHVRVRVCVHVRVVPPCAVRVSGPSRICVRRGCTLAPARARTHVNRCAAPGWCRELRDSAAARSLVWPCAAIQLASACQYTRYRYREEVHAV